MAGERRLAGEDLTWLEVCRLAVALTAEGSLVRWREASRVEDGTGIAAAGLGLHVGDSRAVAPLAGDAQNRPVRVESAVVVPGERRRVAADAVRAFLRRVEVAQRVFVLLPSRSRDPATPRVGEGEPQLAEPAARRKRDGSQPPKTGPEDRVHRHRRWIGVRHGEPDPAISLELVAGLRADSLLPGDRARQHCVRKPAIARCPGHCARGPGHRMFCLRRRNFSVAGTADLRADADFSVAQRTPRSGAIYRAGCDR